MIEGREKSMVKVGFLSLVGVIGPKYKFKGMVKSMEEVVVKGRWKRGAKWIDDARQRRDLKKGRVDRDLDLVAHPRPQKKA